MNPDDLMNEIGGVPFVDDTARDPKTLLTADVAVVRRSADPTSVLIPQTIHLGPGAFKDEETVRETLIVELMQKSLTRGHHEPAQAAAATAGAGR
ncbi:hypothetical protein [Streptomyces sp. NPDC001194]|uniref:hypothetical protein n=1 Tax=Streptomyces sp. NPDC001194 TaxID=3364547 RepID=UPI0036B71305